MEKRCFRMGVDEFLGKQLTEDSKFSGQDDILNAVTDEISNRGFIIGQADKLFTYSYIYIVCNLYMYCFRSLSFCSWQSKSRSRKKHAF